MYQIDTATAAASPPAPSAPGTPGYFTDGDPAAGVEATILPAEYMNMLMRELLGVLSAAGISPSKTQFNQVVLAIETLIEARAGNYSVDTGVANAYVIALNPAVTAYSDGLTVRFRVAHANTGACTLNAGAGVVPLMRDDGTALQSGDYTLNAVIEAVYDSGAGGFLTTSIVASQLSKLGATKYIEASTSLSNGRYLVNAAAPGIVLTLDANPTKGDSITLQDFGATWTTNPPTISRNGKNIMGLAQDLVLNVSDVVFTIAYNGTEWRLI